jgi:hypothetical protein
MSRKEQLVETMELNLDILFDVLFDAIQKCHGKMPVYRDTLGSVVEMSWKVSSSMQACIRAGVCVYEHGAYAPTISDGNGAKGLTPGFDHQRLMLAICRFSRRTGGCRARCRNGPSGGKRHQDDD